LTFSALFILTLVLIRAAVPADPADPGVWLANQGSRTGLRFALGLTPFTGIAFLWYMGVLRNRIGAMEDRFFATAFLGSGFLFVATLFTSAAISQGLLEHFGGDGRLPGLSDTYVVGRRAVYSLLTTFALKMAAVFMFVTSMIAFRTRVLPRWITFVGFGIAFIFLVSLTQVPWISLLFPCWVMLVSAWILLADVRRAVQGQRPSG
jgi:hypothetical protein